MHAEGNQSSKDRTPVTSSALQIYQVPNSTIPCHLQQPEGSQSLVKQLPQQSQ